jgi:hypothetical protein
MLSSESDPSQTDREARGVGGSDAKDRWRDNFRKRDPLGGRGWSLRKPRYSMPSRGFAKPQPRPPLKSGTYPASGPKKLTFAAEKDDRVPADLFLPTGAKGKLPAVLCLK